MLNRLLDGLASRLGLALAVATVVAVSTAAGLYFDAAAARLDGNPRRFDEGQLSPAIAVDYESLCRVTDFALYASKLAGRGRYTFYDKALECRFFERRAMLEELPLAVVEGGLEVFLRPKYELDLARVAGFEALVRWWRKGRVVEPVEFIRLAEESGMIAEIDFFVLAEASRTLARWNEAEGTDYSVSVNLPATHFNRRGVVAAVVAALGESGLPPQFLTLEITEPVQIHDWESVARVLGAFREIGCRVSIDDSGTGYSSLAHVRALAADELKIDCSLLSAIEASDAARFVLDAVSTLPETSAWK